MKINTYERAVEYLESFIGKIRFEITPEFIKKHDPLERMRVLLDLLGNPQDKFPSILIGGTSGKGSTAYLISHILTTAGYKTGLTISPHLQKINERIQINGRSISNGEFISLLTLILSSIEGMKRMSVGAPSYFEIIIAMAFLYFAQQKVDIAVVEVGMGGEYDATNTLYPLVAVLTNVTLDHTNILGGTVQKIARTKAGIIKKLKVENGKLKIKDGKNSQLSTLNSQLIVATGVKQPSVIKIVEDRCKEVGAEVFRLGKDFDYKIKKESLEGSVFDLTTACDRIMQLNDLNLSFLGRHQVENASLAIATVLQLKKFGFKVFEEHIRKALKTASFPGRFEIIHLGAEVAHDPPIGGLVRNAKKGSSSNPTENSASANNENFVGSPRQHILVLDGAHNPTKMRAFLTALKKLYPKQKKIFVIAFKSDKNIKGMLKQILKVADALIVTEFRAKTDMNLNASYDALKLKTQMCPLRSASPNFEGQANVKSNMKVIAEKDSKKALDKALSLLAIQQFNSSTIIVVTGSLYLVGEVRSFLL